MRYQKTIDLTGKVNARRMIVGVRGIQSGQYVRNGNERGRAVKADGFVWFMPQRRGQSIQDLAMCLGDAIRSQGQGGLSLRGGATFGIPVSAIRRYAKRCHVSTLNDFNDISGRVQQLPPHKLIPERNVECYL